MTNTITLILILAVLLADIAATAAESTPVAPQNTDWDKLLVPKPRRAMWLDGALTLPGNLKVTLSKAATKRAAYTAQLFVEDLASQTGLRAKVVAGGAKPLGVTIRLESGRRRGLAGDRYRLEIDEKGALIRGAGEPGLFYGIQTFLQLPRKGPSGYVLPHCRIEDWPHYRFRMLHYDLAREQTANIPYLKHIIDILSHYKINMLKLYFENNFQFERHPLISPPGAMTAAQAKELDEYARRRFVEIVPEVNTLGHMENTLVVKEYRHLAEDPNAPYEICASSAEAKKLIADMIVEVSAPFATRFVHVGGDETGQTGTCPVCSEAAKTIGKSGLYIDHFLAVHKMVKARGLRMMMWGDMLLSHKDVVSRLPKDIIIFDWHYDETSKSTVEFFRNKGFEVFVCPALKGYNRIAVPYEHSSENIHTFIKQGSEAGALGECTCAWELRLGNVFDNGYFGVIDSADASWNPTSSLDDFNRRFCKSFFGLDDTRPIDLYRMVSDDGVELLKDAFGSQANAQRIAYLAGLDELADQYGGNVNEDLLVRAEQYEKQILDLLGAVRKDCLKNRDALDFLDMPAHARVYAVRQTLYYKQARDLISAAKESASADPKGAEAKLAQAESLIERIEVDLSYFQRRFQEIADRFGGSPYDLERVARKRSRLDERKAEIAQIRAGLLR